MALGVCVLAFVSCQKEQVKEATGVVYVESLKDKNKLVTHEEYIKEYYAKGIEKDQPVTRSNLSCWIPGRNGSTATQGKMCTLGSGGCTVPTACVANE